MNSSNVFPNFFRFATLVLFQALVLKQVGLSTGEYFNVFVYPLFILFLPIELPTAFAVMLGFVCGLVVDFFYVTPGLHASAGAFSGFARMVILGAFEPRGGYTNKEPIPSPAFFGWRWFLQVAAIFFVAHLFWYFSVDEFTPVYFAKITLKSISAWFLSMLFVVIYGFLFHPKQ